jgi:uncharacterized SAM-binding protein YcdF (DUF218 family)
MFGTMARQRLFGSISPWRGLLLIFVLTYAAALIWLTRASERIELRKVDCIIVPGARALPDGPGPALQARIDHAVQLWKQGWSQNLLTTGGLGASHRIESLTARDEAVRQGVPGKDIACEGRSHTTWENFLYAREIMRQRGWNSCLVCTEPFHEPRCLLIARELGIEAYPAPAFAGPGWTQTGTWLFDSTREGPAFLKLWLTHGL